MKQSGVPYERIAFVSFAKSTIRNLIDRLDLTEQQSQWFRTIHSMNFQLLGLQSSKLAANHLHTFPARFSKDFLEREQKRTGEPLGFASDTIDDKFYTQMMYERGQMLPRDYVPPQYTHHSGLYLHFKQRYFDWLRDNDLIDFHGMLERGIAEEKVPPVDLLCVDEWQDLSPLQVYQVNHWAQHIPQSVHAGDDDQTIHAWAGARHEDFISFPSFSPTENKTIILNKTYRLPKRVLDMSIKFITRNKNRVEKDFDTDNNTKGQIIYTNIDKTADILRAELKNGSCKVLVRNHAVQRYVMADLMNRGIPVSTVLNKLVQAIAIVMETKDTLTIEDLYFIADNSLFPAKDFFNRGAKKGLKVLADNLAQVGEKGVHLDDLPQYGVKEAFIEAVRSRDVSRLRGQNIDKAFDVYKEYGKEYNPVEVTTIHQSKGTEADTVVISLDVTKRVFQESSLPDKIEEERRVWYVAMTRCKKNLVFLEPTYRGFYKSPLTDYVKHYLQYETSI